MYRLGAKVRVSHRQGVLLPAKREAVIEERVPLEAEIRDLQEALGETKGRLEWLEEENIRLRSLAGVYRARWTNEVRRADLLEQYEQISGPCISQAGWLSSSPDRSYGTCLSYSAASWN